MKRSIFLLSLLIACLAATTAGAQSPDHSLFLQTPGQRNAVLGAVEFDPTITLLVGYGRKFEISGKVLSLNATLGSPVFLLASWDHPSLAIDADAFVLEGCWNVRTTVGVKSKAFDNVGSGHTLSTYAAVMGGYFTSRWFSGVEVLYRHNVMTYLRHDGDYLEHYPDAVDGWYWNHSGFVYFSLKAGVRITGGFDAVLRISYKIPATFELYEPFTVPWAFSLGVNYSF